LNVDLRGKTALITGGTMGIGLETALALAGAGAECVLSYKWGTANEDAVRARFRDAGRHQRLAPARIAVDDARAVRRFAHALRVGVECEVRDVLALEQPRQVLAAAAVPADDDMTLPRHRQRGDLRHFGGTREPVVGGQLAHPCIRISDQQRSEQHRQDHRREDRPHEVRRQQSMRQCERQHHQRELAGLGEIEARAQRRGER